MNTKVFAETGKTVLRFVDKHSPTILVVLGSAGVVGSIATAVRGTLKAEAVLNEAVREKWNETGEDTLTPMETVKACWTCYIPTAVAGSLTILAIVGSNAANAKRYAALASAYAISTDTLKAYKDKVKALLPHKKAMEIEDEIAKDKIIANPPTPDKIIFADKDGVLCYDVYSGRYFKSDIEKIRKAQNDLNQQIFGDMCVSMNEFYMAIGLDPIKVGDDLGWNTSSLMDIRFSSHLTSDGTPCLVIDHSNEPLYNYRDY